VGGAVTDGDGEGATVGALGSTVGVALVATAATVGDAEAKVATGKPGCEQAVISSAIAASAMRMRESLAARHDDLVMTLGRGRLMLARTGGPARRAEGSNDAFIQTCPRGRGRRRNDHDPRGFNGTGF
jgi:hypothetical protein